MNGYQELKMSGLVPNANLLITTKSDKIKTTMNAYKEINNFHSSQMSKMMNLMEKPTEQEAHDKEDRENQLMGYSGYDEHNEDYY